MKVAVLGGSFNPIHIGHLALADEVCSQLGYDRVLFVPTCKPPHKEMSGDVDATRRLAMVRAACRGDRRFVAEDCEITRGGVSFTYDTICFLEKKYAGRLSGPIGLVMGDDLLPGFHLWNMAQELSQKCQIIIARRPMDPQSLRMSRYANAAVGEYARTVAPEQFAPQDDPLLAGAVQLDNPMLSVSSTDIRRRAGEGMAFSYLVPRAVLRYIVRGGLYGYKQH